jgi:hypothetical protein
MFDICCCLKKKLYNKISNGNNDDTKIIYNNLKKNFLNRDYIAISNEDLYDIYTFIYKEMTVNDLKSFNFRDIFIINLYESIILKYKVIKGKNLKYFNRIFSKLLTVYLFTSANNLIISTNFLIEKPHLFDIKLWLELILDPNNTNDEHYLFISIFLINKNVIVVNSIIPYYNLTHNFFEYIILGKTKIIENNNNKVIMLDKFINIELIINFIKQIHKMNKLVINNDFLELLKQIYYYENIDKNYIDQILNIFLLKNDIFNSA